MTHKQKVKLARKMRTPEELKEHVGLFRSKEWEKRKESRLQKLIERSK